uniref:S-formylglutathione hydrolase n=1 Tax=Haemonchus contortus TaxID=6289 RepID=A0A7I4XWR3_HAECO
MAAELVSSVRCFRGRQNVYKHHSNVLKCDMLFGAYVPDHKDGQHLPGLFYLSGLTCTHANFMEKSGFQRYASEHGMIVVHPDTSPRGVDLPGDSDSWDFGKGAGFYVDATEKPWSDHYRMYSYVTEELLDTIKKLLPIDPARLGIFGHSMGGHGAILIGLKRHDIFKSISAFAPICHPINCPWGQKALKNYLGPDTKTWEQYDSSLLLKSYNGPPRKILVDQGASDSFLSAGQLQPESLKSTDSVSVEVRTQPEYDHSYYFIATFIEDHFKFHADALKQ